MADSPPPKGLRARLLKAGIWTMTAHVIENLIRLGTSLVMTRLLVPEDFGLMAMAITIPVSLAMLSDVGIRSNVIKKSNDLGADFLRTAWTVQATRGILLWGFVLIFAYVLCVAQIRDAMPVGSLLSHPQLPYLLATMGSILVMGGLESVNIYVQERDIHFKPLILRSIISKIIPVPVMLVWAILYPSVWSLVGGALLAQAILTLSSHILIPGPPMKFLWDRHYAKNLLGDGKWIALSSTGTFIVSQGDRLILATMLTATQMGLYAIAWTLTEVTRSFLQRINGQITLPLLSEVFRTRPQGAVDVYYRYRRPLDVLAFTGTGFLWMASPEIIHILYDDRYAEAGWILQILSLSLAPFPFLMINACFVANGEWRNSSINSVTLSVSFFAAVWLGYSLSGSTGVIWAIALYSWPATFILLTRAYRRGWVDPIREIVMLPFVFVGLAVGFAVQMALRWIETLL